MTRRSFFGLGSVPLVLAAAPTPSIETRVAIQSVCAWPKPVRIDGSPASDGSLCVAVYVARGTMREGHLLRSRGDGGNWHDRVPLNVPGGNETWFLHSGSGHWHRNWGNDGVDAWFSENDVETWGTPFHVANCPFRHCGYASMVEPANGSAATAYYTRIFDDDHYEMRVAHWNPRHFTVAGLPAA